MRWVFLAALAVIVAGCAQPVTKIDTTVDEAMLTPFRAKGPASISGQAFLRQQGGGVVTCAGSEVTLLPDLPPVYQTLAAWAQGRRVESVGPKWGDAVKRTTCDAQGNFHFENLPLADWYLMTDVVWTVGCVGQGGTLGAPVSTKDGGHTEILLTDANRLRR